MTAMKRCKFTLKNPDPKKQGIVGGLCFHLSKDTRVEEKAGALAGAQNQSLAGRNPTNERLGRLVHRQPLLLFAVAAVLGILIDSAVGGTYLLWGGLCIATIAVGAATIIKSAGGRQLAITLSVLVALPLAGLRHCIQDACYENASVFAITGTAPQPTILEGVVDMPVVLRRHPLADAPSRRDQSPWQTQIEVRLQRIRIGHSLEPYDGRLLVVADGRRDELRPGDLLRVYGAMRRFAMPTNPGERDLRAVYRQRDLQARVDVDSEDQIVLISEQSRGAGRTIASIAAAGRESLLRHTSESLGPLAVALVIGQRDFVDPDTRDLLLVTGTAHLLSVSGLHLAIIVVLASWTGTLLRLPPTPKMIWMIAVCFLYTAITGGRPPVMRASILVVTFMFAIWMRRTSQPINTLSLAALILIAWNPEFVFSIGVQLSFLAVATLILCGQRSGSNSPVVEQAIQQEERLQSLAESARWRPLFYLRAGGRMLWQLAWFSGCVTAISMPLVWLQFHVVSPVSVLANVVLSPFLFLSLAAGVTTVVCGFLFEPLAIIPGLLCNFGLWMMRWLIESAAAIPYGHFWLPAPSAWSVGLFYAVMVATLFLRPGRAVSSIRYGWIIGWVLITWIVVRTPTRLDEGSLEATFVDVGHGTCAVLRFSEHDVWLYDCGRLGNDTGSSRDIDVTLWSLGVTNLRGILLSHADADHFNALPGVLRRFGVSEIVTPPGMLDEPEIALDAIRHAIDKSGAVASELYSGATMSAGGQTIRILHPPRERMLANDNANSLVLQIDCGDKTLILPGDLEPPGTELLVQADRPPPGGVLMAPHHGSLSMDAATVLQWARPSETIVSGGQRAQRPEVQDMLSFTGSGVHVTSDVGAIRVRIDREGKIEVRTWTKSPW